MTWFKMCKYGRPNALDITSCDAIVSLLLRPLATSTQMSTSHSKANLSPMESADHLLQEGKHEFLSQCPACDKECNTIGRRVPHRRIRIWIISTALHTALLVLATFALKSYLHPALHKQPTQKVTIDCDKHLIGSVEGPNTPSLNRSSKLTSAALLVYHERLNIKIENVPAST